MRPVPTFSRLLPVLCAAGALLIAPETKAEENGLTALVASRLSQLNSVVNGDGPLDAQNSGRRYSRPRRYSHGPTQGLGTSSLEANTRLDSTARGLTASEDWRRMFPRKEQR